MGNSEQILHPLIKTQLIPELYVSFSGGVTGVLRVNVRTTLTALWLLLALRAQRTLHQDRALTSYPLHLHAPRLYAALGQALLGDDAADMVREDKGGLEDGEGL